MSNYINNNEFFSENNKHMLWDLMYSGGIFSNVSYNNYNNVKQLFDNKIIEIFNKHSNNSDLTTLNKFVISSMIKEIENMNQTQNKTQNQMQNQMQRQLTMHAKTGMKMHVRVQVQKLVHVHVHV